MKADSILRDLEQKITTMIIKRLLSRADLLSMDYKRDDMPMIDITLPEYKQGIRVRITAEWIDVEEIAE